MGLRESRIINSVHPWLGVRLLWLQEVAKILGGRQSLISGNRSLEKQRELYDITGPSRPAAFPGCSQHNYGFAADATWLPFLRFTTTRKLPKAPQGGDFDMTSQAETDSIMENHARRAGLTVVPRDVGHLQIYPG